MAAIRFPQDRSESSDAGIRAIPGAAILPLRIFLGATFVYASYQKATDPGFFKNGSATYIGTQITGFSHGTPIGGLLAIAAQHAVIVGALTILTEFTIGCLTLVGLFTRGAALTGLFLNLTFFLSASWLVYPYFLGSDIVFVAAWMTLVLTGPGDLALDFRLGRELARYRQRGNLQMGPVNRALLAVAFGPPVSSQIADLAKAERVPRSQNLTLSTDRTGSPITRRQLGIGILAAAGLFLLGITPRRWSSGVVGVSGPLDNQRGAPVPSHIPKGAQKIGNTSHLPTNRAVNFTDNQDGQPGLVIHNTDGQFVAFSAVCTHAGCTVAYKSKQKLIVCPCHGSQYDANNNAAVQNGPAPSPLPSLPIKIARNGDIFLV